VLALGDTLAPGTYVVSFRVLSGDAHPISGGFRFSITGPDIDTTLSAEPDVTQPAALSFGASDDIAEPTLAAASSLALLEQTIRALFIALALMAIGLVVFQALIPLPGSLGIWLFELARRIAWFGMIAAVNYVQHCRARRISATPPLRCAANQYRHEPAVGNSRFPVLDDVDTSAKNTDEHWRVATGRQPRCYGSPG